MEEKGRRGVRLRGRSRGEVRGRETTQLWAGQRDSLLFEDRRRAEKPIAWLRWAVVTIVHLFLSLTLSYIGDSANGLRLAGDDVEPPEEPRCEIFGRGGDAREPALVDRIIELFAGRAALHLDEGDERAPPRDQIHLAGGGADAPREDAPALEPQPPRRRRLADAARALGPAAVSHAFIASARA